MSAKIDVLSKSDIENLNKQIEEKNAKLGTYSREKLVFEKERCEQILNRNIPMCLSLYTKNILQSDDKNKILGQLHRLNLECYWKILNIELLAEINKRLGKYNER
jgi:hypothetical protein